MSLGHGASIVRNGLVLHLDAANRKSYNPNLLSWGQSFDNIYWSKTSGLTINSTTQTAPDFTQTATIIEDTSTSSYSRISRNLTIPNDSQSYTFSVYVEKTEGEHPRFAVNSGFTGGSTLVQTNQRVETTGGTATNASIASEGDYWRVYWTLSNNSSGNTNLYFNLYPAAQAYAGGGDTPTVTGTATIWGAMITRGTTLQKYVPNFGSNGDNWKSIDANKIENTSYNGVSFSENNGGAVVFDGVDDYIDLPSNLGYTNQVSSFSWYKSNGTPAGNYHIIMGGQELEISIHSTGYLRVGVYQGSRFVSNHGSGLVDGNWHNIGFTFDGSTKTAYIDGQVVGTQSVSAGTLSTSFMRRIGRFGSSGTYYANGEISDVKIYNRALTDQEVKQNFEALRGRYGI